jgi:hypothetical protein
MWCNGCRRWGKSGVLAEARSRRLLREREIAFSDFRVAITLAPMSSSGRP